MASFLYSPLILHTSFCSSAPYIGDDLRSVARGTLSILFIFTAHVNARYALSAHANPELNGLAAHLAIFDVVLLAYGSVNGNLKRLPAVRAVNVREFQRVHAMKKETFQMRQPGSARRYYSDRLQFYRIPPHGRQRGLHDYESCVGPRLMRHWPPPCFSK